MIVTAGLDAHFPGLVEYPEVFGVKRIFHGSPKRSVLVNELAEGFARLPAGRRGISGPPRLGSLGRSRSAPPSPLVYAIAPWLRPCRGRRSNLCSSQPRARGRRA